MEVVNERYELFVVHAAADEPFVRGHLLPALGIAPNCVLLASEFRPGASVAAEIERGVHNSRFTHCQLRLALSQAERPSVFTSA